MKTLIVGLLISAILTIITGFLVLPLLKKLKIGQPILKYVTEHKSKSGTPTMGGVFFVLSATAVFLIFTSGRNRLGVLALAITIGFMAVGFIDDFLKIKLNRNEGLTALQKLLFQIGISLIASFFAYESGLDFLYLPFTDKKLSISYFSIPLNALVFVATVNSVNLTDGLDGLCGSVSLVFFLAMSVIIVLQIESYQSFYLIKEEYENLSLLSSCMAGAMVGYLLFNTSKASVFMGDTGSLAIGGAISSISIFSGNTLLIPVMGICYVLSSLSVIIQVVYYKKTNKRLFLMAPLHHHYQKLGFSEAKISYAYAVVTAVIGLATIISYL